MNKPRFEYLDHLTEEIPIIFHFNTIKKRSFVFPHWHPNVEILFVTSGEGTCMIGSELCEMRPGNLVIVNSNFPHAIRSDDEFVKYDCLIVDTEFCTQNGLPTEKLRFEPLVTSEKAVALYQDIVREIASDSLFHQAGIRVATLNLMLYLSRNHLDDANQGQIRPSAANENIKLAIGYIKSHIDQKLTLDEIASEVGLSKYYFLREFKNATTMTPVEYINSVRCENAKKLLLKKKYPIHEIAQKCGFTNDSYFSKVFRHHTGLLPSEFVKGQDTAIPGQY